MIIIDKDQCIKCGICISYCLQGILSKGPEGININETFECFDCEECLNICPVEAILKKEVE
jgi:NAD-dependent dihydropyrimidine dehydrogenase PreA subunit